MLPASACGTRLSVAFYRRNLPHWQPESKTIFLTWRLYGSLPAGVVRSILSKHRSKRTTMSGRGSSVNVGAAKSGCVTGLNDGAARSGCVTGLNDGTAKSGCATDAGKEFVELDHWLDSAEAGPRWLSHPQIAALVERAIFHGAELGHYALLAYVIMPNHVHVLLEPGIPLPRLTNGLKGVSSRDANARLGRVGMPFWQDESFDHWVRSAAEGERIRQYIEWNPVKAGLTSRPDDWRWSSACPEVAERILKLARAQQAAV